MNKRQINELTEICKKTLEERKSYTPRDIANAIIESCDVYRLPNNQFYCKYGRILEDEIRKIMLNAIDENVTNTNIEKILFFIKLPIFFYSLSRSNLNFFLILCIFLILLQCLQYLFCLFFAHFLILPTTL